MDRNVQKIDFAVKSFVDVLDSHDIDEELRENWESYGKVLFDKCELERRIPCEVQRNLSLL
jgi:hypothetical protein